MTKIFWYLKNLFLLSIASVRLLIYCFLRPKKLFELGFLLFSILNEFYQVSHGKLRNFQETKVYKKLCEDIIFSKSNVFNTDSKVTRAIETQVISALVYFFQPKTIFEIGTYSGFTTMHFAKNSPEDCKIFTLDLGPNFDSGIEKKGSKHSYDDMLVMKLSKENVHNRLYQKHIEKHKIRELFGDSSTFDFSSYYGKMDIVFIDGNHSHKYVKSDTESAMKMLSENGIIVWHDFDYIIHRDIFKYLNKLSKDYNIYSIPHTRFAIYGKKLQ